MRTATEPRRDFTRTAAPRRFFLHDTINNVVHFLSESPSHDPDVVLCPSRWQRPAAGHGGPARGLRTRMPDGRGRVLQDDIVYSGVQDIALNSPSVGGNSYDMTFTGSPRMVTEREHS